MPRNDSARTVIAMIVTSTTTRVKARYSRGGTKGTLPAKITKTAAVSCTSTGWSVEINDAASAISMSAPPESSIISATHRHLRSEALATGDSLGWWLKGMSMAAVTEIDPGGGSSQRSKSDGRPH